MPVAPADVFTLAVGPWQDTQPSQEIGQFGSVSVSSNLDDGVEVSFDIPGRSPTARAIDELATDVWLYRESVAFVRARVVSVVQTWGPDGDDLVSVTAVDYKRLLNARHVWSPLTYSGVDQAQIVLDVINHTQALTGGSLGIIAGTLGAGFARDRTYKIGENIGKVLGDLSGVINGPWWGIDADRQLNCFPYFAFPVRDTPVMLGATARSLTRQSGASEFANAVFVDGDDAATVPVQVEDVNVGTDPRGRWERAAGFPNVVLQPTLDEKADGLLEASESPIAQWSCELEVSRFLTDLDVSPGEYVEVVVPPSVVAPIESPGFSVGCQVMSLSLALSGDGAASVSVELIEVP